MLAEEHHLDTRLPAPFTSSVVAVRNTVILRKCKAKLALLTVASRGTDTCLEVLAAQPPSLRWGQTWAPWLRMAGEATQRSRWEPTRTKPVEAQRQQQSTHTALSSRSRAKLRSDCCFCILKCRKKCTRRRRLRLRRRIAPKISRTA